MRPTELGDGIHARIRAGEREAFGELYEAYARTVYNHALRLTGNWSTAEEVMSETFLAAWRTRERLEPEGGSLKPWLLGIATHKAQNANRGLRRRLAFLHRQPPPPDVADFSEESAGRLDDARRLAAVHGALRQLRRPEREVLVLCVWSGLDYAQAAEALGIPVGTVRSRLSRARARLRRLSEDGGGGVGGVDGVDGGSGASASEVKKAKNVTEPLRRRGEVESEAAFAALPLREEFR